MPALRLTTSKSILLAPTPLTYHARLLFGPVLKRTLNHDITRCHFSRSPKNHAEEDKIRGPSENVIDEELSQPKHASLIQKLSDKSGVQTIKPHNHSQTKREGSGSDSAKNITSFIVNKEIASEKKSESEYQEPARYFASNQMLADLSRSSKDEIGETSKKRRKSQIKKSATGPNLSLLEELFPEGFGEAAALDTVDEGEEVVPRLPLVDFNDEDDFYNDSQNRKHIEDGRMGEPNLEDGLHEWDLAVLVVSRASKSLVESDFRRLVPRGQHIDGWRGPGDILKGERTWKVTISIII